MDFPTSTTPPFRGYSKRDLADLAKYKRKLHVGSPIVSIGTNDHHATNSTARSSPLSLIFLFVEYNDNLSIPRNSKEACQPQTVLARLASALLGMCPWLSRGIQMQNPTDALGSCL